MILIQGYTSTTYFWSAQGSQLRYAGTTAIDGFDDVIIQGSTDPKDPKFSAFYVKDNKVIAVMGIGTDPTVSLSAELLYGPPSPSPHPLLPRQLAPGVLCT
jgi:apoptosis-inducing factor 3